VNARDKNFTRGKMQKRMEQSRGEHRAQSVGAGDGGPSGRRVGGSQVGVAEGQDVEVSVNPRVRDQFASSRVLGFGEQTDDAALASPLLRLVTPGEGQSDTPRAVPFSAILSTTSFCTDAKRYRRPRPSSRARATPPDPVRGQGDRQALLGPFSLRSGRSILRKWVSNSARLGLTDVARLWKDRFFAAAGRSERRGVAWADFSSTLLVWP
jgi:hypothetical protein